MPELPFQLRYVLTRRQRLIPHLKIWRRHGLLAIFLVAIAAVGTSRSWCLWGPLLFFLFVYRGFFLGFLNVLLVRKQAMDIVVEQNGLGYLSGNERWYFALDGLTGCDQLASGVWTIQHWNGSVVNVPAELLSDEQVEFLRDWVVKANAIRKELGIGGSSTV